ncbi:MAG TPA: serine hydrolase domain-containing protein [Nevskiaceae bacterium]|nr:serine hydrolase domain-containing protein [Nevskiaceae bacterium]
MTRLLAAIGLLLTTSLVVADATTWKVASADTPSATPAGTTFSIPKDWKFREQGALVILEPPEPDLRIGLIDVQAKDATAAVAAGWAAFEPGFKRPLRAQLPSAPRNGWEERWYFDYETSPNEKWVVGVQVMRKGDRYLLAMMSSSQANADRFSGPVNLITTSLRPKGYTRESFAGRKAHPLDARRQQVLRDFLAVGMEKLKVPGVGYSLIENGKVIHEGGIGVRERGKPESVDADTRFLAASNTKALVTLLLGTLVDEKKLRWDQPVVEAYPAFKLGDAATTASVKVRHLICACTGLPRQDLEWLFEFADVTPARAMEILATMQPTTGFGELFQYSNPMAAAAGYIGGHLVLPDKELGAAFDQSMQRRVFDPLGMTRTTFDFAVATQGNWARPHDVDIDGVLVNGRNDLNYSIVPVRPAGGVWTTAHDLSRYVMMELGRGQLPGSRRLVSEAVIEERVRPNVLVAEDFTYGMGLMVDRTWGIPIVSHGGDMAGFHSDMIWLPDHGIGATILTNGEHGYALRRPFLRKLLEVLFDGRPEADAQLDARARALGEDRRVARKRLVVPADPKAVAALAPRYRNDVLGDVGIVRSGQAVEVDIGEWRSAVATRVNDDGTTSLITISPNLQDWEFVVGGATGTGQRTLIVRDNQHEYVFREVTPVPAP